MELAPSLTAFIMSIPVFGDITMVLTALVIAVFTYRRQKKLAERINRELEQRSC